MAHLNKIAATSPSRQHPSELETNISSALFDLESNTPDMKSALRPLQFTSAREVWSSRSSSSIACYRIATLSNCDGTNPVRLRPSWAHLSIDLSLTPHHEQIEVSHGKKAIVIFVPVPLLQGFHKVQQRYTPSLSNLSLSPDHNSYH